VNRGDLEVLMRSTD